MQTKRHIPREALKPERAFIVQVGPADPMKPSLIAGHIEHIASGDHCRFTSLEELATILDSYRARH